MRRGRALGALLLAGASVLLLLGLVELALRTFPSLLPAGAYGSGSWDPELQMNTHRGAFLYNKHGRTVWRSPNRTGFMDVEHEPRKPAGTRRLAVFGDSYVQALQVPLEQTFFRRLPDRFGGEPLEVLGFGMSGWGTLHSLINARVQAPRFDPDVVIYVFVENDLGDNSYRLYRELGHIASPKPYADLAEGEGFEIRWLAEPGPGSLAKRVAKFAQNRSLLAQLVWQRIYLLYNRGIAPVADPAAGEMAEGAGRRIDSNTLPSSWPPSLREHVEELGARILARFAREMEAQGRAFAVLYVPRGEAQLRGEIDADSLFAPWLERTCARLGIPLIDPSAALLARLRQGDPVYGDHWSPAGHEVIAGQIAAYLETLGPS